MRSGFLDSSIIQGPFSVAPCQTLISRFATFASPYFPLHDRSPSSHVHVHRASLGFVHRKDDFLSPRAHVTIRNFYIAVSCSLSLSRRRSPKNGSPRRASSRQHCRMSKCDGAKLRTRSAQTPSCWWATFSSAQRASATMVSSQETLDQLLDDNRSIKVPVRGVRDVRAAHCARSPFAQVVIVLYVRRVIFLHGERSAMSLTARRARFSHRSVHGRVPHWLGPGLGGPVPGAEDPRLAHRDAARDAVESCRGKTRPLFPQFPSLHGVDDFLPSFSGEKVRGRTIRFGTNAKMALERSTPNALSRRTCHPWYGLHSWGGGIRETAALAHLPPETPG
jgi:hypothetical protein